MPAAPILRPPETLSDGSSEPCPPEMAQPLVQGHAQSSLSAQAAGPGFAYAAVGGAVVPHVRAGACCVAAGPPVPMASSADAGEAEPQDHAADAFARWAEQRGLGTAFFGVSAAAALAWGWSFLPLGEEMVLHPAIWCSRNRRERSIAAQLRRAVKHRVEIIRLDGHSWHQDEALCAAIDDHARAWQARHAMPPMGFVVALRPKRPQADQELWLAYRQGALVAFAVVLPIGSRGYLIEHIVRGPHAPNGTAELLIDAIVQAHAAASEISLGLAPLSGPLPRWLRMARWAGGLWYNFAGLEAFKLKLHPHERRSLGLAYPQKGGALGLLRALVALLRAFAGGSLVLFAVRLLARGPTPVLVAMAAVLPLWMWGLSILDTAAWFVAPWVQQAWLVFDGLLCLALWGTLFRPSIGRLRLLSFVVTLDACTTLIEALVYPGPKHLFGLLLHAVGVLAPTVSAVMLWGAARRAARMAAGRAHVVRPLAGAVR